MGAVSAAVLDLLAQQGGILAGAALLVLALAVPLARQVATAVGLAAAQAACLAAALLAQAWLQGSWQLAAMAAGTVAVKLVALPRGARVLADAIGAGAAPGWLAVASAALAVPVVALAAPVAGMGMAVALAVVLAGALVAALRRDAAGQLAGTLTAENGLVLALAGVPAFPGVALLAVATLALPAAVGVALLRRVLPAQKEAP